MAGRALKATADSGTGPLDVTTLTYMSPWIVEATVADIVEDYEDKQGNKWRIVVLDPDRMVRAKREAPAHEVVTAIPWRQPAAAPTWLRQGDNVLFFLAPIGPARNSSTVFGRHPDPVAHILRVALQGKFTLRGYTPAYWHTGYVVDGPRSEATDEVGRTVSLASLLGQIRDAE